MTALALKSESTAVAEIDRDFMPVVSVEAAVERFKQIGQFISRIMHKDTDFGVIPGTSKPTLYKPGAEKLCTFFGLRKVPEIVERVEDWTGADHGGEPFFYYTYRYHLYRNDTLIASADGSCNSWEKKYRWRDQDRVCPHCDKPTVFKSKKEPGWFCWSKKGGCGAQFRADDPAIADQKTGRTPNPDVADLVNTIQKMAQKRALVAATLLAVNASEFFTQDVEDFAEHGGAVDAEYEVKPAKREAKPEDPRKALNTRVMVAKEKLKAAGRMTVENWKEALQDFNVDSTGQMSNEQLEEFAASLERALQPASA